MSGTINNDPYYSDCRWKTQNVTVHDNGLRMDETSVKLHDHGIRAASDLLEFPQLPPLVAYQGHVIQRRHHVASDQSFQ
ncbi:MAG: hypothetical protein M3N98_10865 [Actinomycetota bacterium]|nr:hypothetical protein [Actinomycetota bacterium]